MPSLLQRLRERFRQVDSGVYVIAAVAIAVWLWQWPTLDQPLLEAHWFRQSQTAYQTLTMYEGWGSLLHPKLPILGAPWEVPFEFPFFQFSAMWLMRAFSLGSDVANRSASLMWFTLCLVPLWGILRLKLDRLAATAGLIFFAFSPLSLQWSRAGLMETCAVFFSLCFILGFRHAWVRESVPWFAVMVVGGCLAGAVKVTTLATMGIIAPIITPGILDCVRRPRETWPRVLLVGSGSLVVAQVSLAWRHHADRILQASEATRWLSSSNLKTWTFGTLDQRSLWENWKTIIDRVDGYVFPRHLIILLLLIPLLSGKSRGLAVASMLSMVAGVSVFFNLYFVHDYYLVAVMAQASIILAVGVGELTNRGSDHAAKSVIAVGSVALLLSVSLSQTRDYWSISRRDLPPYVNELTALSTPDQQVIVGVADWDPTLLYNTRRRGIMFDPRGISLDTLRNMPDLDKYDFYQGRSDLLDVIGVRGWYAPAGSKTIRLDDLVSDLATYPVILTSLPWSGDGAVGPSDGFASRRLACDGVDAIKLRDIPTGTPVRTVADVRGQVFGFAGYVGVPVGESFTLQAPFGDEPMSTLRCLGMGVVTLIWSTAENGG